MRLVMLDRDGVVIVNRKYNVKTPEELCLLDGAAEAIARFNRAGIRVALCTNQPEVDKGIVTAYQLDAIHGVLQRLLAHHGARLDLILCCTDNYRSKWRKPAPDMLLRAMRHFGAKPSETPFVGDQCSDLQAAANAHCPGILVRTGLGRMTEAAPMPDRIRPAAIHDNLASFADAYLCSAVMLA